PQPVLTVSPSWTSPGDSVTLTCSVGPPSAGWRFFWFKAVHKLSPYNYTYDLLAGSTTGTEQGSYVLHGQTHTAGYVCRAGRGDPVIYTLYSDVKFVCEERRCRIRGGFAHARFPQSGRVSPLCWTAAQDRHAEDNTPVMRMSALPSNLSAALCDITVNCSIGEEWAWSVCDVEGCRTSQRSNRKVVINIFTDDTSVVCRGKNNVSVSNVSESREATSNGLLPTGCPGHQVSHVTSAFHLPDAPDTDPPFRSPVVFEILQGRWDLLDLTEQLDVKRPQRTTRGRQRAPNGTCKSSFSPGLDPLWFCPRGPFTNRAVVKPNWPEIYSGETITLTCGIKDGAGSEWEYEWRTPDYYTPQNPRGSMITSSVEGDYRCKGRLKDEASTTEWSKAFTLVKTSASGPENKVRLALPKRTSHVQIVGAPNAPKLCRGSVTLTCSSRRIPPSVTNRAVVTLQHDWPEIYSGETITLTCGIKEGGGSEWEYEWRTPDYYTPQNPRGSMMTSSVPGDYRCKGRLKDEDSTTEWSDAFTLTTSAKPKARLSKDSPVEGSVTLTCSVGSSSSSS
ncbi:uncharacterized protein LOC134133019, partial [Pungitius pungitius]|uniref:uncharacterized protein LOC134133019 n=1 Tax=Pungitius pungitius TaxID=134920 RepID=UPI002E0E8D10